MVRIQIKRNITLTCCDTPNKEVHTTLKRSHNGVLKAQRGALLDEKKNNNKHRQVRAFRIARAAVRFWSKARCTEWLVKFRVWVYHTHLDAGHSGRYEQRHTHRWSTNTRLFSTPHTDIKARILLLYLLCTSITQSVIIYLCSPLQQPKSDQSASQ